MNQKIGRPQRKRPPTENQRRLLKITLDLDGSIAAFARRAGVPHGTVRAYLFDSHVRVDVRILDSLVIAGWPRALIIGT